MSAREQTAAEGILEYEIKTHDQSGYETFFIKAHHAEIVVDLIPSLHLFRYDEEGAKITVGIFRNWIHCVQSDGKIL